MRISDWSSDVCSSDLRTAAFVISSICAGLAGSLFAYYIHYIDPSSFTLTEMVFVLSIVVVGKPGSFWGVTAATAFLVQIGRASCRERVCQYVSISVVAVSYKTKKKETTKYDRI